MTHTSWRDHSRPIIAKVLRQNEGKTEQEIRKALREAYPYGERAMWPYKIWCDEIQRQRGLGKYKPKPPEVLPLFGEEK